MILKNSKRLMKRIQNFRIAAIIQENRKQSFINNKNKKMKKLIILLVILTGTATTFAQSAKEKMPASKSDTSVTVLYTCTMHPEVLSDKPGKCPKCGMDLVKKKVDKIY